MRNYWNYDGKNGTAHKKPHLASPSWIAINERVRLQYSTQLFFALSTSILISRSRSWFQNISLVHFKAFRSVWVFFPSYMLLFFFLVEFFFLSTAPCSHSRWKFAFFSGHPTPKYIPSTMFFTWFFVIPCGTFVLRGADNEPYYTPAIVKLRWRKAVDEK